MVVAPRWCWVTCCPLPVADGFLYVEPVYVRAAQDGYPLLRRVLVSFGQEVAFERNLEDALAKVLGATVAEQDNQNDKGGKEADDACSGSDASPGRCRRCAAGLRARPARRKLHGLRQGAEDDLRDAINRAIDAQRRIAFRHGQRGRALAGGLTHA